MAVQKKVVRPGFYGVEVEPGPDWESGGFYQQGNGTGTVLMLTDSILKEWAKEMVTEIMDDRIGMGGWSPTRSAAVRWSDGCTFYYKCGDSGLYDLQMVHDRPAHAHVSARHLYKAVFGFTGHVKRLALRCTKMPKEEFKVALWQTQTLIDAEWGHFYRLLRAQASTAQKMATVHNESMSVDGEATTVDTTVDTTVSEPTLCLCTFCTFPRLDLTDEEISKFVTTLAARKALQRRSARGRARGRARATGTALVKPTLSF